MKLTNADLAKLARLHPDLRKVITRAAESSLIDFKILETTRSLAQQRINLAKGVSKTLRSRHLVSPDGYSRAVDIVPLVNGKAIWAWPAYYPLARVIKQAAIDMNVTIEWGGDWRNWKDGPHWQLPWRLYP